MSSADIPVIDFGPDIDIPERSGARATASMCRLGFATCTTNNLACGKLTLLGFFYVKNHPIAQSHINDIFELVSFKGPYDVLEAAS